MRSRSANLATRGRPCGATWPVAAWPDPSSRRRDLAPGGWCPAARTLDLSSLASGRRSSALGSEWGAVDEHAMQDNRELSCEGHLGLAHARAVGDTRRPALQCRASHRAGQDDVRRLVQRRAHAGVTDLADASRDVGLAGLVLLGRQAEMRADCLRRAEPPWVVHRRSKSQGYNDADTGYRHEQLRSLILTSLMP